MMPKVKEELRETSSQNVNTSSEEPSSFIDVSEKPSTDRFLEREYQYVGSAFITRIVRMMEQRNYDYELRTTIRQLPELVNTPEWVNVRFRCLVEALLTLSERQTVLVDDLFEISNAFAQMTDSSHYTQLPENYPYKKTIKDLREKLRMICLESVDNESTKFNIAKAKRMELIVIRCELRTVTRKRPFSQHEFTETKPEEKWKTEARSEEKAPKKKWQINYEKIKRENNR